MEAARVEEGLKIEPAMRLLGMSRSSYYRQVRGMTDYQPKPRQCVSIQHRDALREVALGTGGSVTKIEFFDPRAGANEWTDIASAFEQIKTQIAARIYISH